MGDKDVDEVRQALRAYVQERFPVATDEALSDDVSLLESGIVDSLGILDLVTFVEGEYGIVVDEDELVGENFDSISALHTFVCRKR